MGSSDYMRHQGKEGRRRKTRAAPRTYHHKVTVPRPHSSCQLSRLRSNHVRLHRARTPRRPSLPLNPSAAPLHLALAERGNFPSAHFSSNGDINQLFYTSPPPSYSSFPLCACETRDGGHVLPVTARKRGLPWQSAF